MVTRLRMFDISKPPSNGKLPPHCDILAGYIGGETPHVWTASEWASFGKLRKLPIFVRVSQGVGWQDGFAALEQLYLLGVPKGNPVAYDKETSVHPLEVAAFNRVILWGGYTPWTYGSADFVFKNHPINTWVAKYTGTPFMFANPTTRATQYTDKFVFDGLTWDVSTVKWWQYRFRFRPW